MEEIEKPEGQWCCCGQSKRAEVSHSDKECRIKPSKESGSVIRAVLIKDGVLTPQ